jgi:hypothetical protein
MIAGALNRLNSFLTLLFPALRPGFLMRSAPRLILAGLSLWLTLDPIDVACAAPFLAEKRNSADLRDTTDEF